MSERELRRRVDLPSRRRAISWAPKPSSSRRRIRPVAFPSKPLTEKSWGLRRSHSEPLLSCNGVREKEVKEKEEAEEDCGGVLDRPRTCTDIFDSQENYYVKRCNNYEIYNKDAKVVVNVTVEGSPGPIRTMVKLGSNVEETIKLVVNKYNEEGRTPRLSTASTFQLHHSHFSIQSLSMSDLMGDVGSRSFYLRKSFSNNSGDDSRTNESMASSNQLDASRFPLIPRFFDRKIRKFISKTRTIWKLFGCLPYT